LIRETLRAEGKTIETDAESLLVSLLGADRAMSRMELEKLIIYCGDATSVTVDDIQAVITGSQVQSAGDAAFAVFAGDVSTASAMLDELIASGVQPISILRAAALHAMRLHLAVTWYANGRSAREAMDNLKPKVFFRQAPSFQRQLESWTEPGLTRALELLADAEIDCKTTGLPAAAVCIRTLLRIAQAASRQGRRAS
jgi:DNA polymerase-3 subunit delta